MGTGCLRSCQDLSLPCEYGANEVKCIRIGGASLKRKYMVLQGLMILNQLLLIAFLCVMNTIGATIPAENIVHIVLLTFLFWDGYYISGKNVKGNPVLSQFAILLILFGWHFGLSLFSSYSLADTASVAILPICLYQLMNFVQAFLFQGANYKGRRIFLSGTAILCFTATLSFFIDRESFYILYNIQFLVSFVWCIAISVIHRKRVWFVLRSQRKQLLFSAIFVLLPFICYMTAFSRKENYVEQMGLYLIVMLTFVSIHSIIFRANHQQKPFFSLSWPTTAVFLLLCIASFVLIVWLFGLPILTAITLLYLLVFCGLLYRLLLFWKASRSENNASEAVPSFYEYTIAQLKHEEALRKEFTNYLHDDILQDLLSMKNLVRKAGQIEIQQLLEDTLRKLTSSIRSQMQAYHPKLLKNLTFKENLQSVLDSITNDSDTLIALDCKDDIFLVEPYTMLICRFARELAVNALKHSHAARIDVRLQQENDMIILQVSDNGAGFSTPPEDHSIHHGLASIQEQVSFLNGKMTVKENPDGGTNVSIFIPMKGDESYARFVGR